MPKPLFLCKHLGLCTIFLLLCKSFSLLLIEKSTVQISFFYCAKKYHYPRSQHLGKSREGSDHPIEIFLLCKVFGISVSASRRITSGRGGKEGLGHAVRRHAGKQVRDHDLLFWDPWEGDQVGYMMGDGPSAGSREALE